METDAYRTPIQRFYAEQSIFITGIYYAKYNKFNKINE